LEGLAIAQTKLGWHVAVATTIRARTDRQVADRLRSAGVAVTEIPIDGRLASNRPLRSALKTVAEDADLVHVHAVWEELQHQACVAARRSGTPYILSPHGMLDPWSLAQNRLMKAAYLQFRLRRDLNRAVAIHCTTETEARLLKPLGLRSPTFIVPNGIDLGEFQVDDQDECFQNDGPPPVAIQPSPADQPDAVESEAASRQTVASRLVRLRKRYPLIVLFLSRLHPKKGLDLLLPAFANLQRDDVALVLAGPGDPDYVAALEQQCRQYGIDERVVFTGMLNGQERIDALRAADLFVLPSYQENFGIAVVESLATGTPVIISDQVNLADQIEKHHVGQVIPTDAGSLTTALALWLNDQRRRDQAAQLAKPFASRYDFANVAHDWQRTFGELGIGRLAKR
jgi:glycosyltransferase involved in cell wall biosynthesis